MNVRSDKQPMIQTRNHFGFLFRHARTFTRDEDGALVIFGVYVFLIILMVAGIGVDLMHFERNRAKLQYTLDRAVLAAADLDNTNAYAVVTDYFNKAGLGEYLSSVTIDEGDGFRSVSATAKAEVRTQFMHMTGIDSLMAPAASTAEERVDGIEISLVLDVSGSMAWNNRLTNLKSAARNFIDEMILNTEPGKLSISIVPYATQVSVPDELFNEFNVSQEHNYSNCINFDSSDFNETSMGTSVAYKRTMHFDPWYTADRRNTGGNLPRAVCDGRASREILVMENDPNTLKNFISNLSAGGNTSIDLGMKWGTALLDPSLNPVIQNMIAGGSVNATFSARPHTYNDTDALKVIVLMTDGQNTSQYFIEEGYRQGHTNIWWNSAANQYSVLDPSSGWYFWPDGSGGGSWSDHIHGDQEDGNSVRLNFGELWGYTTIRYNLFRHYRPWMSTTTANNLWYYDVFGRVNSTSKNSRTNAICDAVKNQQVIVFAIGFEAPSGGQAILASCASSPSHYFNVSGGAELTDAFYSIASSIRKLRLTQ
jgi:Flp pilus assembly protein TadG